MKVPLSWLKEYIDLPYPPTHIAKILTSAGLEVDGVNLIGQGFKKVFVAVVTKVEKHPNAEKLCVATVNDGTHCYQVVCGAPNCREGIKTAFATIGAELTDEGGNAIEIKRTSLRGVESMGMLCSLDELGIPGEDGGGIVEFASHIKEGTDVSELYADVIFEISLTPNLAHCNSILGIARELSVATGNPLIIHPIVCQEDQFTKIQEQVQVEVKDYIKCPRYACRVVQNVQIGPSPDWIQKRLNACGVRPINNIVDITNYVLLELGQPLHAFDFDHLEGKKILVRDAKEGESFETLDGKERVLSKEDLLICDGSKSVAIAGVMGGSNSEVSESTKNVLIESAHFRPQSIRRTSKKLGLQTDASKLFERGTDPNGVIQALDKAAMLMQEVANGKIAAGVIDCKEQPFRKKEVTCRLSRIHQVLGTNLGMSEVESIFHRLEMKPEWDGQDLFTVAVPTYRGDVQHEIDLVEEVARIYGFENLERKEPCYRSSLIPNPPIFLFENEVRMRMIAEGLQEFITCDLIGPKDIEIVQDRSIAEESFVKVLNPTSIDQSILRTSLLPGLLKVVKYNIDQGNHDISGFEIGRVHFKQDNDHYKEQSVVGIVLSGKSRPYSWDVKTPLVDFFDLKGIVENLLKELRVFNCEFSANHLNTLHSGRQVSIYVNAFEVGSLGEVHPSILRRLDVKQRIYFAELNLHDLLHVRNKEQKMQPIPIFPASDRDWTITVPERVTMKVIFDAVRSANSSYLQEEESVSFLENFRSDKVGKGLKNVTLRFLYRDLEKTIDQKTVDAEHARVTRETDQKIQEFINQTTDN